MQNAQELYNRIQETRRKIKAIRQELTDRYKLLPGYIDIQEELKGLRDKRKQITLSVDQQYPELVTSLDDLKIDLASDREMLNDVIVSKFMKGETIELENEYQQAMLPIFNVILKPE